jgi:hypothetical protein
MPVSSCPNQSGGAERNYSICNAGCGVAIFVAPAGISCWSTGSLVSDRHPVRLGVAPI